ncbi:MAG: hypothetical protein MMC33_006801 [Icmadophila ericetorum]|nr:hypothetical protein [Icmadophila ericetorum]
MGPPDKRQKLEGGRDRRNGKIFGHDAKTSEGDVSSDLEENEIRCVKPVEFAVISQRDDIINIDKELNKSDGAESVRNLRSNSVSSKFVFIYSSRIIRLRGPAQDVWNAKTTIENALAQCKRFLGGGFEDKRTSIKHYGSNLDIPRNKRNDKGIRPHIYTVRVQDDSRHINLWTSEILPRLPNILNELLGTNYSAALIRQGLNEKKSKVVIRIQSPKLRRRIKQAIRTRIQAIYKSLLESAIPEVKFQEGRVCFTAGGTETEEEHEDDNEEDEEDEDSGSEESELLHYRRWWKHAGMGASLGLRYNNQISATLGGYVEVNGIPYLLTVDHFIEKARRNAEGNPTVMSSKIVSPSLLDISYLQPSLEMSIKDVEVEMERLVFGENKKDEYTASEVKKSSYLILNDWYNRLQTWRNELEKSEKTYIMGEVYQRCDRTEVDVTYNGQQFSRKMDWALCTVERDRKDENRHRYRTADINSNKGYTLDGTYPHGAGELCTKFSSVEAGVDVHYVGAGTGYQKARVNPPQVLLSEEGKQTCEWALVLLEQGSYHKGDSGAWILQDNSNSLVGMLWGEDDSDKNSLLYFTPIDEIFQQIKKEMEEDEVEIRLPPTYASPIHHRRINPICREEDKPPTPRASKSPIRKARSRRSPVGHLKPLSLKPSLYPAEGLNSPSDTRSSTSDAHVMGIMSAEPLKSPSLVPSLVSSESSVSDTDASSSPSTPESYKTPLTLAQSKPQQPTVSCDNELNKHSLAFIMESFMSNLQMETSALCLSPSLPSIANTKQLATA